MIEAIKQFSDPFILNLAMVTNFWEQYFTNFSKQQYGNFLIYLAGAIWGIELIPQLRKTHKSKCVKGISLSFFLASLTAYTVYMIGSGLLGNWNIVLAHIPSLVLTLWMAILIIVYRRRRNEESKSKIK